jgi:hypothetical protein
MNIRITYINIVLLFVLTVGYAQPAILYTSLTSTTPSPTNNRFAINDLGLFRQVRFQSNQTIAASTATWAYHTGTTGVPDYNNNWRPNTAGNTISINTYIPTSFANGAKYNSAGGGADGLLPAITSGNYYTFNVLENIAALDNPSEILETTYQPINLISQTLVAPITTNNGAFLTVIASATPNAVEYVYVRYSTDGYATSGIVPVVFSNVTGTSTLPCFAGGTNVKYYYFSSNKTAAQLATDVAAYGQATAYDLATLSIFNNGGSNYNYTQPFNNNFEGTYYIPSACYVSLASFITAINGGFVANNVVVNIASGYTETAPIGGFRLTANGGVFNRAITFQKNGSGANPTFTASGSLVAGAINDALFKIIGGDFITIDGLTFLENTANTITVAGTNNMTEFGIALFYNTISDGCQNVTLKNNTIDLNKIYQNTFGIYANSSHNEAAVTTPAGSLVGQGSNNNLKIVSNIITDVNNGICIVGSPSPADHNEGIIIGGLPLEGNTISDFGTTGTFSAYNAVSTTVNGVLVRNTKNFTITNNLITSSNGGVSVTGNIRGICNMSSTGGNAPLGTFINTISNNAISITGGNVANTLSGIVSENLTGSVSSTLNINNNRFFNFGFSIASATGGMTFISNSQSCFVSNINGNVFDNITANTSGSVNFIDSGSVSLPSGFTKNVNNNSILTQFTKSVGNNVRFYQDTGSSLNGSIVNNLNNNFSNITLIGGTILTGWNNQDGASSSSCPTKTITGNVFSNINLGTLSSTIMAVNGFGDTSVVNNNIITNITGSTGIINGLVTGSNSPGATLQVSNNTITNLTTTGAGAITGLTLGSPSNALTASTNNIKILNGGGAIIGISSINSGAILRIQNSDIDDLKTSSATQSVVGISNDLVTSEIDIVDNAIKNLLITNTVNTGFIRGINCTNTSGAVGYVPDITGNTLDVFTSNSTNASNSIAGIFAKGSSNYNVNTNVISNLSTNSSKTNLTDGAALTGIFASSTGNNQRINNNTIHSLTLNNTTTINNIVVGILTDGNATGATEISKNKIYNLQNKSTIISPTAKIYGLMNQTFGSTNVTNNMISLGNGSNTNGVNLTGIFDVGNGGTKNYYYNSIQIFGNTTSTLGSFGANFNKNAAVLDIKNNIFQNVRTGLGKNYALVNLGTNFTGLTLSNNNLYSNNPNTIGLISGPIDYDFTAWNVASGGINSFSSLTTFINPSIGDLHIDTTSCADANDKGIPVIINDDFDTEVRDATTPDIGADEHTKASTIWNGTVWNPSAPTSSTLAIIEGNYDMTLGVTRPSLDACSLIIRNNAKVTVSSGKYLNLENNLTVANNALLEIQDGGSYIQINNNGLNTTGTTAAISNFSAKRNANIRELDYVYWSAPVTAFPVSTISPSTPLSKIWNWNTIVANPNGGQGNWENISENMIIGKGYIVRGPTAWNPTIPTTFTAAFLGKPNNGVYNPSIQRGSIVALTTTGSNSVVYSNFADNWNLIGNPYPSSIKAASFLTANTNIEGAVRIWTHGTLPISIQNPFYNSFVYNYTSTDYIVYNGTATTSGPTGFGGNIASGQGFFVVMNDGPAITDKVTFTNAMRNKTFANNQFYKSTNTTNDLDFETLEKHRIWLDLISENNQTIRTVVGYVEGATQEKDRLFDAYSSLQKQFNFFSIINDEVMTIQGRSLPFENTDTVPMGIRVPTNGSYTIAIATSDGLFANNNQTIYLEDKLLNSIHNLSLAPYLFNANQGLFTNRFVLRYTDAALVKPSFETLSNSVSIFSSNNSIKINSTQENIISYIIYDVLGRILASGNNETKYIEINTIAPNNQPLIVKSTLENSQVITKKVIF